MAPGEVCVVVCERRRGVVLVDLDVLVTPEVPVDTGTPDGAGVAR